MATRKKSETFQIVIAWTCVEHVHDGKPWAADLGRRPGMREIRVGKACMWLNRGTAADLKKARAYAAAENAKNTDTDRTPMVVFRYPSSESEPLARARREVVACPTCKGSGFQAWKHGQAERSDCRKCKGTGQSI